MRNIWLQLKNAREIFPEDSFARVINRFNPYYGMKCKVVHPFIKDNRVYVEVVIYASSGFIPRFTAIVSPFEITGY